MISSDIISSGGIDNILKDLYIDESQLEYQRKRYINALNRFQARQTHKMYCQYQAHTYYY
jgi:hypothetical protein